MGFRPFTDATGHTLDHAGTFEQACERPVYMAMNLMRADLGNPLFGNMAVVIRNSWAAGKTLVSPLDTGAWVEGCCNNCSESASSFPPPLNCSAYDGALGTLEDFSHMIVANHGVWDDTNHGYWRRLLTRLWGSRSMNMSAYDIISFVEADLVASAPLPTSVKHVLASFPMLFGSSLGRQLQETAAK